MPFHGGRLGEKAFSSWHGKFEMKLEDNATKQHPKPWGYWWRVLPMLFNKGSILSYECISLQKEIIAELKLKEEEVFVPLESHLLDIVERMRKYCARALEGEVHKYKSLVRTPDMDPRAYMSRMLRMYESTKHMCPQNEEQLIRKFTGGLNDPRLVDAVNTRFALEKGEDQTVEMACQAASTRYVNNIRTGILSHNEQPTVTHTAAPKQAAQQPQQGNTRAQGVKGALVVHDNARMQDNTRKSDARTFHCTNHGWNSSHETNTCKLGQGKGKGRTGNTPSAFLTTDGGFDMGKAREHFRAEMEAAADHARTAMAAVQVKPANQGKSKQSYGNERQGNDRQRNDRQGGDRDSGAGGACHIHQHTVSTSRVRLALCVGMRGTPRNGALFRILTRPWMCLGMAGAHQCAGQTSWPSTYGAALN